MEGGREGGQAAGAALRREKDGEVERRRRRRECELTEGGRGLRKCVHVQVGCVGEEEGIMCVGVCAFLAVRKEGGREGGVG